MYYGKFTLMSCILPSVVFFTAIFTFDADFTNPERAIYVSSTLEAVLFVTCVAVMARRWCIPHHKDGWKFFFAMNILSIIANGMGITNVDFDDYDTDFLLGFLTITLLPVYTLIMMIIFVQLKVFEIEYLVEPGDYIPNA